MSRIRFFSALCTPLTADENLHPEGLAAHVHDQRSAGIHGLLVGGSMGSMQLLRDQTYRELVTSAVQLARGEFEILAGAGDTSFGRTRERVEFLNIHRLDGALVLAPFFIRFSQRELIDYYRALADISRAPLYLYDLPQVVGTELEIGTVQVLAKHPNIAGIKCSGDFAKARQLNDLFQGEFRVIAAQADLVDVLLRHRMREQLDGMFAVAPQWTMALARAAESGDWGTAAACQQRISALKQAAVRRGDSAFTALLNARGIPGNFFPRPTFRLEGSELEDFLAEPIVQEFVTDKKPDSAYGSGGARERSL